MHTSVHQEPEQKVSAVTYLILKNYSPCLRGNIFNCRHYKVHRECVGGICKIQREFTTLQRQFEFFNVSTRAVINFYEQKTLPTNTVKIPYRQMQVRFNWKWNTFYLHDVQIPVEHGKVLHRAQSPNQGCESKVPWVVPLRFSTACMVLTLHFCLCTVSFHRFYL